MYIVGDFPRAWSLLLDHIESSALCRNAEVALAALKSLQEILHISKETRDNVNDLRSPAFGIIPDISPPLDESINRTGENKPHKSVSQKNLSPVSDGNELEYDLSLWSAAWKVWVNIGMMVTQPPPDSMKGGKFYVPAQTFLTALVQTFPSLFEHIKSRFTLTDFQKMAAVFKSTLCVPVQGDASPFVILTYPEITTTPLQEAVLHAMEVLIQVRSYKILESLFYVVFEDITSRNTSCDTPKQNK